MSKALPFRSLLLRQGGRTGRRNRVKMMVTTDLGQSVAEKQQAVSGVGRRPWLPPVIEDVSVEMTRKTSSTMESTPGDVKIGS